MTLREFLSAGLMSFAIKGGVSGVPFMLLLMAAVLLCAAAGYFLGCFNTAIAVSRHFYGTDIRNAGSGNAGMTNMFRVLGKKAGFLTLGGDVLKTLLACAAGCLFFGDHGSWIAGFFCVLGHMFPCFENFRGGKGVLVTATVLLLNSWPVFLMSVAVFIAVILGTRIVSMASVMAALLMPLFLDIWFRINGDQAGIRFVIALGMTLLVVFGHMANLKRIYARQEPKITLPWDKKNTKK